MSRYLFRGHMAKGFRNNDLSPPEVNRHTRRKACTRRFMRVSNAYSFPQFPRASTLFVCPTSKFDLKIPCDRVNIYKFTLGDLSRLNNEIICCYSNAPNFGAFMVHFASQERGIQAKDSTKPSTIATRLPNP